MRRFETMKTMHGNSLFQRRGAATLAIAGGVTISLALMMGGVLLQAKTSTTGSRLPVGKDLGGGGEGPHWDVNPVWYDGKAEYATYAATRTIYGVERKYDAVLITNKQQMDPQTMTKSENWQAPGQVEVFKHNLREVIPTENYDYKFLTTVFLRTADWSPFKLTMSSQEDCGATFKQVVAADGKRVAVDSFVYFPGGGETELEYDQPDDFQFHDGLTLSLRGSPFDTISRTDGWQRSLQVLPDQTDTHATGMRPMEAEVSYAGLEMLSLPIGEVEAHRLEVVMDGGVNLYWFAGDGGQDWLHIMVKYEGADGVEYALKSKKWWAYWER